MYFATFPFANLKDRDRLHTSCCAPRPAARGTQGSRSCSTQRPQTGYQGARRPRQYLFVSQANAIELGQKAAFHVDASRIARLPLTTDYFPEMVGDTIRVRGRDAELVARVEERLRELIAVGVEIARVDAVARPPK
jgi:hypothetical protein